MVLNCGREGMRGGRLQRIAMATPIDIKHEALRRREIREAGWYSSVIKGLFFCIIFAVQKEPCTWYHNANRPPVSATDAEKPYREQSISYDVDATPILRCVLVKVVRLVHVTLSHWYARPTAIMCLELSGWCL